MNEIKLHLEERKEVGGGRAERLRKTGYIPAVVYGCGIESEAVQVKTTDLRNFLNKHGRNSIFKTEFAAENDASMLIKDMQFDVLRTDVIHVDFQKVSLADKIHAEIPVKVVGGEKLDKANSVIVYQLNEVAVECLPQDIPQYVTADIAGMVPGHSLKASQLKIPQGVTLITSPDDVILSITSGRLDLQVNKVDEEVRPVGEEGHVQAKKV